MSFPITRTFNDLYLHELETLLSAETQMIDMLPGLARSTETGELKAAFTAQVQGCTEQQIMLQALIASLDQPTATPVSRGIEALLQECSELLKSFAAGNLRDAVMIAHMQRAEHYKMASYASVREYASLLGDKEGAAHLATAEKAVTLASRTLAAIAIQIDAEAYVDTRVEGT